MDKYSEILIVDDMPEHIAFAGSILKSKGYIVYAATSGETALRFLENKKPDLIVLDINMEGLTGFEVCKIIKSNPDTKDIPVIFLTAETSPQKIKQGFEVGCCDYVRKPFVKEEYLARVTAHLNISRQNRELAAAYNELNLFCSAVSHDLKSPLNVIHLLIDSLKNELNENLNSEVNKITDMLSDKSSTLITMIERLLEFSRMCNINPEIIPLNLNEMIDGIFAELKSIEPARNITIIADILPDIEGDEVLIKLMLENILSNAFKFTQYKDNAVISVSGFMQDGFTVISIKDNGAGFDMQYADKLFGVFQRLHDQEQFHGSGVGLAMVDRIMKRHGGKVRMLGEVDKGAEILLYFKNPTS